MTKEERKAASVQGILRLRQLVEDLSARVINKDETISIKWERGATETTPKGATMRTFEPNETETIIILVNGGATDRYLSGISVK